MRIFTVALAGSLISATALAQGRPPQQFDFHVLPEVVQMAGDTTEIEYAFVNTAASRDSVFSVTLDAPSPVLSMSAPSGNRYLMLKRYGNRPVATWVFLTRLQPPATRLEGYRMRAIGLPGIVPYWVSREELPDTVDDEMEPPAKIDRKAPPPVNADTDTGSTVGIVPFPPDRSRAALAIRLGDLLGRACAMHWIDNPGVCTSLLAKIRSGAWEAMRHELDAQREKHVSPRAYYLLRGNLDVLLWATPRRG